MKKVMIIKHLIFLQTHTDQVFFLIDVMATTPITDYFIWGMVIICWILFFRCSFRTQKQRNEVI